MFYKKFLWIVFVINTIFSCYAEPDVSVIIPIYNTEKDLLIQCLDSVTNQTLSNIEIICVNDGSTNTETVEIIHKFAKNDNRIVVINQNNQGVSAARNTGLNVVKAKYVMFVDSDDYIHPQMIEIMLTAVKENGVDIAVCNYQKVDTCLPKSFHEPLKMPEYEIISSFDSISFWTIYLTSPCNKIYSISLIDNEKFDVNMRFGEDLEFNIRVFEKVKACKIVDISPYYYRVNNFSAVRSPFSKSKMNDLSYLVEKVLNENNLASIDVKQKVIANKISYAMERALSYLDFNTLLYSTQKINDLYLRDIINFGMFKEFNQKILLLTFILFGKMQSAWLSIKKLFCNSNDIKE